MRLFTLCLFASVPYEAKNAKQSQFAGGINSCYISNDNSLWRFWQMGVSKKQSQSKPIKANFKAQTTPKGVKRKLDAGVMIRETLDGGSKHAFADQGITLTNVDRIVIGLGNKGNMTNPGGSGKMFIDDIRLYRPREAAE